MYRKFIYQILFSNLGLIALLSLSDCGEVISPAAGVPSDIDSIFDVAYVASMTYEDEAMTIPISNGKSVRAFEDIIGDKNLFFRGQEPADREAPLPEVYTTPSVYSSDEGGYVFFPNVRDLRYFSIPAFDEMPQPYDVYIVMRDYDSPDFEKYFDTPDGFGFRNEGDHFELIIGGDNKVPLPDESGTFEYNKISIVRILYNGSSSRVWVNNELFGGASINNFRITRLGLGTISNNAHWDFFGMWIKFGRLSDAESNFVYQELSNFYKIGYPDKPLADSLGVVFDRDTKVWSPTYKYVNTLGHPEDMSRNKYQWYWSIPKQSTEFNLVKKLPGPNAQNRTLDRDDYPTELQPDAWVYQGITVYDDQGNFWKELHGPWVKNNIP